MTKFRLLHSFPIATGLIVAAACGGRVSLGSAAIDGGASAPLDGQVAEPSAPADVSVEAADPPPTGYVGRAIPTNLDLVCNASPAQSALWETKEALFALMLGQWLACPDHPGHGFPGTTVVGLELTEDGQAVKLLLDNDGLVVRGTGIDNVGEWRLGDDEDASDKPSSVLVRWGGQSGWLVIVPVFTRDPEQMRTGSLGRLARP